MSSDAPEIDRYAEVSVHGLWPIVSDAQAPGGIRFAEIGRDPPEACIRTPEDLPDAEISIRTFVGTAARDAWIAAAREFGGNSTVCEPFPHNASGDVQAVLVFRLDRDRPQGGSLEEVVPLLRDLENYRFGKDRPPVAGAGALWRSRYVSRVAEEERRSTFSARWTGELTAIGTSTRTQDRSRGSEDANLRFQIDAPRGIEGEIRKLDCGVRVVLWTRGMQDLVGDHADAWRIAVEAHGWSADDPAAIALDLATYGPDETARVERDFDMLRPIVGRLMRLAKSQTAILAMSIDVDLMKMLKRLAAGLPVASSFYRDPAAQVSPRTVAPIGVAGTRIDRAFRGGLIVPIWWRDRYPERKNRELPVPTPWDMHGILWGLTETGRALAEGRTDDACETHASAASFAEVWLNDRMPKEEPFPLPFTGSEVIAETFAIADERMRENLKPLRGRFRHGADIPMWPEDLARAGAAIAAGLIVPDGTKLARVEDPAPALRP